MNKAFFGALAVIFAALLWSLDGFLRQHLYSLPPAVVVFWEHLLGLAILLPIVAYQVKEFRKFNRQQWEAITVVSFLSGALGTILYTAALGKIQFIPFSVVVLLQQSQPLFAIAAAAWLLRERISRKFIILAVIAITSVYFVSFPDLTVHIKDQTQTLQAALLALGAAAGWGTSTALSKYSLKNTSFLHVTAARFGLTPIFALLFVIFQGQTGAIFAISPAMWGYLVAITFSTGFVALAIYYYGLQRIPASRSTIFELAWPLSAVAIGYFAFGDRLTVTQWIGSLVLLGTMYMVTKDIQALEKAKTGTVEA